MKQMLMKERHGQSHRNLVPFFPGGRIPRIASPNDTTIMTQYSTAPCPSSKHLTIRQLNDPVKLRPANFWSLSTSLLFKLDCYPLIIPHRESQGLAVPVSKPSSTQSRGCEGQVPCEWIGHFLLCHHRTKKMPYGDEAHPSRSQ